VLVHGENIRFAELVSSRDVEKIKEFFSDYQIIAIDEAQMIPDIGNVLKLLVDHVPDTAVIATGSSSFHVSQKTGEPLTGRKRTLVLYPISQEELKHDNTSYDLDRRLEEFLVFGSYPEVLSADSRKKIEVLQELTDSYLLKDIFALDRIKSSHMFLSLLRLLAHQISNEARLLLTVLNQIVQPFVLINPFLAYLFRNKKTRFFKRGQVMSRSLSCY